ncbi:MAG: hypothetical protein HZC54_03960 [Verrucomicrobia bacterium]|nr:hypothetical protein [Verrucomicrobiota bacterium]
MKKLSFTTFAAMLFLCGNSTTTAQLLPANSPVWARAVNLMPLIDPAIDTVRGKWSMRDNTLVSEPEQFSRIQIPFEPPQEYDFRIVFCRASGEEDVNQYFSQTGRMAMWIMGAMKNRIFGFQMVGGKGAAANRTTLRTENCLKNGQASTSVLSVRRNGVKACLNGRLISQWVTDFSDASLDDQFWPMPDTRLLGVASHKSQVVFYRIELLELFGKGKATRAKPSTAPAPGK